MNLIKAALAAMFLFVAGPLFAATNFTAPETKIDFGQNPVPLGELIDITALTGKATPWLEATSYEWKLFEYDANGKRIAKKFRISADSTNIWCAAGIKPKSLDVLLVVTHLFVVREKPDDKTSKILEIGTRTVVIQVEIDIGDPIPPEPPTPPTPPVFPDGKYQLSKWTYDNAMAKVDKVKRAAEAAVLAGSIDKVVRSINANKFAAEEDLLKELASSNKAALGDAGVAHWNDWSLAFQDKFYGLYIDKKIATIADYGVALSEVSLGLKGVK